MDRELTDKEWKALDFDLDDAFISFDKIVETVVARGKKSSPFTVAEEGVRILGTMLESDIEDGSPWSNFVHALVMAGFTYASHSVAWAENLDQGTMAETIHECLGAEKGCGLRWIYNEQLPLGNES